MKYFWASLALAGSALPASAQVADQLDCIATGYSAEQKAVLDAYVAAFEISDMDIKDRPLEVLAIIDERALECASEYGWSVEASEAAGLYQFSDLTADSIAQKYPEAKVVLDKIDTELPDAERERFWSIMTSATGAAGIEIQPTNADFMFIGTTILRFSPGISEDEQNIVGSLIGMEALLRHTEATFSEL